MARTARIRSGTGIYHVMLRGNNKQTVFTDTHDYVKFLNVLKDCKEKDGFTLYAYCLMPNHIHLLLKDSDIPIGEIMRRISSRFVTWYNIRHSRVGHLFQDRFKSEPVNGDPYFCTVLRYIHMNPVKANLCKDPEDYLYSSYTQYFGENEWIDTAFALDRFGAVDFRRFHQESCEDKCMDIPEYDEIRLSDEKALDLICIETKNMKEPDIRSMTRTKQQNCIRKLYQSGISMRQISKLTGIPFRMVRTYCRD